MGKGLKGVRYSLWKNPEDLTENQRVMLAWIAATDPRLYRAYLFKEGLRMVFQMPYKAAVTALDRWIAWARRCRIFDAFNPSRQDRWVFGDRDSGYSLRQFADEDRAPQTGHGYGV